MLPELCVRVSWTWERADASRHAQRTRRGAGIETAYIVDGIYTIGFVMYNSVT